jgi:hypothetical protein
MDRHEAEPDDTADDLAAAHLQDVEIQGKYGVRYLTYWFDPAAGASSCLAEGPSKEAVEAVRRESHGFVAAKIIEVNGRAV